MPTIADVRAFMTGEHTPDHDHLDAFMAAAHHLRDADRLEREFQGVRPSWVSADISLARHRAETIVAELTPR